MDAGDPAGRGVPSGSSGETLLNRRRLIGGAAAVLTGVAAGLGRAASPEQGPAIPLVDGERTSAFPSKGAMILRRQRPPLLETPMEVFDQSVLTPNDRFFVRWHWADIPPSVEVTTFRLRVHGHVERPLAIPLAKLLRMPRVEYVAVNQCSGNSRRFFDPRVPGAQWGHGAMGNARWLGVRLRDILDLAGVRRGAALVRMSGLDQPVGAKGPDFAKSIAIDHARDGEVMVALGMNGEQLPLMNGFPCRLVVPGWYSTYWVKMLSEIQVLPSPDQGYWMAKAYRIPSNPRGEVEPGAADFATRPIDRMVPRSWVTSLPEGQTIALEPTIPISGIAMGGDLGTDMVEVSSDHGLSWRPARLGRDEGRYSFRRWEARIPLRRGTNVVLCRCRNTAGVVQPTNPSWNPGGYMRGQVEATTFTAV